MTNTVRLIHNTGFSLGASILARMAHVILFVLISRLAGPGQAGILTIGLTYLAIVGRLSIWGLDQILIRDVAADISQVTRYLINFILLRFTLAIIVSVALAGFFVLVNPYRPEIMWLIYLMTLNMFPEGVISLCQAVFMAHERLEFMTLTGAVIGILKIFLGGVALSLGFGVEGVIWALLLANILAMVGTLALVFGYFIPWQWQFDFNFCRTQLKIAAPFVLIAGVYMIDNQLDVLLLSWQVDEHNVGLYGAAVTLITGLAFLPQAYRDAVFPRLANVFFTDKEQLRRLYQSSYKYLVLMSLPTTLGIIVLAKPILVWIFGPEFAATAPALQLLAISVGLLFLGILHNRLLIITDQQSKIAIFLLSGLLLNAFLNVELVTRWGITGAAAARLVSNIFVFCATYYLVFRQIYAFDARMVWVRPLIASLLMVVVVWTMQDWSILWRVLTGAIIYGGALLTLGTFSRQELVTWLQILRLGHLADKFLLYEKHGRL